MKKISSGQCGYTFALIILLESLFILSSCGGGGGGGGQPGPIGISYNGVTTQASITTDNANKIFSAIWNGGPSSGSASLSPAISKKSSSKNSNAGGMTTFFKRLKDRSLSDFTSYAGQSKKSIRATSVNDTYNGSVSGTLTTSGNIDPNTGAGSLTMTYTSFNDGDGYTYDGTVTVKVDGFDMAYQVITDATMSFTLWTIKSASSDISLTGSIKIQDSPWSSSETLTVNMDGRDNLTNDTFRYKNFVVAYVSSTETESGQVYIGPYGYVDVTTPTPIIYATYSQQNPDGGGPIILYGAGNTRAVITPISVNSVKIEVDADGDGVFEARNAYAWSSLAGEPVVLALNANAGPDQSIATGSTVTLDGSGSTDLLGNPLIYSWSMTAKPAGSAAVLSNPSSTVTTFVVDQPGTYTVSLIVNNGTTSSNPDTVVVTATGTANSGLFKPYVAYPTGSWPEAVAIGDVNGDGRNDVVLTTSSYFDSANDYHLFVFLQNASGGFDPPVKYPAGNGESVAIGDVNGDGRADVVVTANNSIGVFYQNSSHGLDPMVTYASNHQSPTNTYKVKIGDFNHDGRLDVVSIDWGTQSYDVDIFYQNATGTFDTPVTYTVTHGGYDDLDVGDVNNDGRTDIIIMSGQTYAYPNVGVLTQKPDGTFNPPVYYSVGQDILTSGLSVGDVNGDSLQDIVVSYGGNSPSSHIGAFLQNNFGTLNSATSYASYDIPEPVEIGDVNNDGRKDIILVHGGWNALGVYLQNLSGTLQPEELYPIPYASHYNPNGLAVGDINGDGLNDVVIADYNNGLVVLYHK